MTGASREEMRARHREGGLGGHCLTCRTTYGALITYPCDASRLLDALDEAEQREQNVRKLHVPYKPAHWPADEPPSCAECADTCVDYPCPTIEALDGD